MSGITKPMTNHPPLSVRGAAMRGGSGSSNSGLGLRVSSDSWSVHGEPPSAAHEFSRVAVRSGSAAVRAGGDAADMAANGFAPPVGAAGGSGINGGGDGGGASSTGRGTAPNTSSLTCSSGVKILSFSSMEENWNACSDGPGVRPAGSTGAEIAAGAGAITTCWQVGQRTCWPTMSAVTAIKLPQCPH